MSPYYRPAAAAAAARPSQSRSSQPAAAPVPASQSSSIQPSITASRLTLTPETHAAARAFRNRLFESHGGFIAPGELGAAILATSTNPAAVAPVPRPSASSSFPPIPARPGPSASSSFPPVPVRPSPSASSSFPPVPVRPSPSASSSFPPIAARPSPSASSSFPPVPVRPSPSAPSPFRPIPVRPSPPASSPFPPIPDCIRHPDNYPIREIEAAMNQMSIVMQQHGARFDVNHHYDPESSAYRVAYESAASHVDTRNTMAERRVVYGYPG